MWFMNKVANPFVRLILRSALHGLMSGAILLITYRGRRSGKEYTLPVQYVRAGRTVIILPGAAGQKTWWRNLRGGAPVRLLLKGKSLAGKAVVLEGEAEVAQIAQTLVPYLERFPALAKPYNIHTTQGGLFDQEDLRRVAASTVVVRVEIN